MRVCLIITAAASSYNSSFISVLHISFNSLQFFKRFLESEVHTEMTATSDTPTGLEAAATSLETQETESKVYDKREYAKPDFWNDRFKETSGFFDWYVEWPELKTDVQRFLPPNISSGENDSGAGEECVPKVLMVGCGNSKLSEQMYNDGYTSMVNVDISDVVIDKMRENYKESHPDMQWRVADARNLEDATGTYDCALDKGTVDALMSNAESCAGMAKDIVREMGRRKI